MATIGILALQGAFREHRVMLERLGHKVREIRKPSDLSGIEGLILPGGESTTMAKLLEDFGLADPIREQIDGGLPVMGTCAGLILLSKDVENQPVATLKRMSVKVRRNAYGRQLGSFTICEAIPAISDAPIPLVFIRAPFIAEAAPHVEVLHRVDGHIVAAREGNMLGLSFHPELTENTSVHEYFIEIICKIKEY